MSGRRVGVFVTMLLALVAGVGSLKARSTRAPQHSGPDIASPSHTPKKAEEQFKNIQVLKGIPAEELVPTMQFVSASLGVNCEFCHVKNAFEKDDKKPKQTARRMMEMMFAINADNFDRRRDVTCYSCHRGNAMPIAIPAVMEEEPRTAKGGATTAGEPMKAETGAKVTPTPDQLLDKYVEALGGAAAVNKISSRVMKGKIEFGEQSMPIDIYATIPDRRISFAHLPDGDSITAFDGHEGWLTSAGHPPHFMQGNEIDGASIDADLHLATHLKQMFSAMKVDASEKIGDRETYVVVGERQGKTPIRLYFDQQSGLLLRLVRFGETALGWLPTQIDYGDYREADGVKVPYRWTLARPSGRFTIQLSELQQNVPVDDAKFAKPAAEPPKPAAK